MTTFDDEFPIMLEREAGMPESCPAVGVAFGNYYEKDDRKSAEAGHDVFRDVIFVKIVIPGDKNSLYFQPTSDKHKVRFPRAWEAFQKRNSGREGLSGLPIEQWAAVTRSVALTLKAMHIHTVEALAEVHDGHVDRIGVDGRGLRAKAIAFLAQASDNAATLRLAAEKKDLQDQLAAMQGQMAAMQQQFATLSNGQAPTLPAPPPLPTVPGMPAPAVIEAARKPRGGFKKASA